MQSVKDQGARPKEQMGSGKTYDGNRKTTITDIKNISKVSRTDKAIRHLSVRLCDVLDMVGASMEFRTLRRNRAISVEILRTISIQQIYGRLYSSYIFGSSSEGSTTPGMNPDIDMLACYDDHHVIDNICDAKDGPSFLMVRDKHTQPGYVKLQNVYNGQPQTVFTQYIDRDKEKSDIVGRICVKHVSILGKDKFVDERNGPADTFTKKNIDHVLALRCSKLPEFSREWIGRKRQYKWPPKRMIDKMATMGCFVVHVGHPTSMETDIEWRLSFSLQEREMMFSMNTVQHKCYIVLKIIKKDLIEPIVGKSISSYHLKTCLFHTMENTKSNVWKQGNMFQCVLLCLYVLLKWVIKGYCPNYFINEENMFDRDLHRNQKLNLIRKIKTLLSSGGGFLFDIKLDEIGALLKHNATRNIKIESKLNTTIHVQNHYALDAALFFSVTLCVGANKNIYPTLFINMILTYLSQTKSIKDHTEQQTQKAISYILPCVHIQLAQTFASLAFNTTNYQTKYLLLQEFNHHLRKGRHFELFASVLLEATVVYKLEKYECCIGILNHLESLLDRKPLSLCSCYRSISYYTEYHLRQLSSLSVPSMMSRITTCVKFLRSDMSIIPEALQYEMFRSINTPAGTRDKYYDVWFDLAVVDSVVYLHFMQYLVHAKLNRLTHKNVAINKLKCILISNEFLGHRETGYNLLGWIHFHEGLIQQGMKYFRKSWSIRPHHNAAKLHIMRFLRDRNNQT